MRLSDSIEQFIKTLISDDTEAEFKRSELAQYFNCAPSQINYVLSTRFTPAHGYIIESHRGGGGCIRIFRMRTATSDDLLRLFSNDIGDSIDEVGATHMIAALHDRGLISSEGASLMLAASSQQALSLPLPAEMKNRIRASLLKQMLLKSVKNHHNNNTREISQSSEGEDGHHAM